MSVINKKNPLKGIFFATKINDSSNNESSNKLETVTPSSQTLPILQSDSIKNLTWEQRGTNDPNIIYDWSKHAQQRENDYNILI